MTCRTNSFYMFLQIKFYWNTIVYVVFLAANMLDLSNRDINLMVHKASIYTVETFIEKSLTPDLKNRKNTYTSI